MAVGFAPMHIYHVASGTPVVAIPPRRARHAATKFTGHVPQVAEGAIAIKLSFTL
jgi:hypothetical protein